MYFFFIYYQRWTARSFSSCSWLGNFERIGLLSQSSVLKTVHVAQARVTVHLMTCASQDPVAQITVLLLKPVHIVMIFYQMQIVVKVLIIISYFSNTQ